MRNGRVEFTTTSAARWIVGTSPDKPDEITCRFPITVHIDTQIGVS